MSRCYARIGKSHSYIGSMDRKSCVDVMALFKELNSPDSKLRDLRADHSIQEWVKTLNVERGLYKPTFALCRIPWFESYIFINLTHVPQKCLHNTHIHAFRHNRDTKQNAQIRSVRALDSPGRNVESAKPKGQAL